jgi:hypothetical protein
VLVVQMNVRARFDYNWHRNILQQFRDNFMNTMDHSTLFRRNIDAKSGTKTRHMMGKEEGLYYGHTYCVFLSLSCSQSLLSLSHATFEEADRESDRVMIL